MSYGEINEVSLTKQHVRKVIFQKIKRRIYKEEKRGVINEVDLGGKFWQNVSGIENMISILTAQYLGS